MRFLNSCPGKISFLFFVFISVGQSFPLYAVYTSHLKKNSHYRKAADNFPGVILIESRDSRGRPLSTGSGMLIRSSQAEQFYVLTASHVLKGGVSYHVVLQEKSYEIQSVSHFHEFLFDFFPEKTILVAKNNDTGERLFVLRLKQERDRLKEVLVSYGLDIGLGVVKGLPSDIETIELHETQFSEPEKSWVAGFGESGQGYFFGEGFAFWTYGSGTKRAFETVLTPRYQFEFLEGDTMESLAKIYSYSSIFNPGDGHELSGHVGPGDSGGPAISQTSGKVMALVSGTIPMIKKDSLKTDTYWKKIIRWFGARSGSRSPLSYLFWHEANVYGSEAIYAGVGAPLMRQWIRRTLSD